jgi:adenylate cyclase
MRLQIGKIPRFSWRRMELAGGRLVSVAVLLALLVLRAVDPHPLSLARSLVFDYFQLLHPRPIPEDRPVMIVDIDEDSLAQYGQWPWPRSILAQLVDNLSQANAAGIGFDMVFPEADRMSPAVFAESAAGLDPSIRKKLEAMPSNDQTMADAVKRGNVVVGVSGLDHAVRDMSGRKRAATVVAIGGNPKPWLDNYRAMLRNVPEIDEAAAGWGVISVMPEADGVIRHVPAAVTDGDQIYPTLSLELLRLATGNESLAIKSGPDGVLGLIVKPNFVATDKNGKIWLYASKHDPAKFISAKDVLQGKVDPGLLQGRLVLVGTSATGLKDGRTTAVERQIPGVEMHAQIIETILSGLQLSYPADAGAMEWIDAMIGGLFIIALLPMIGARWTGLLLLIDGAGLIGFSWYHFVHSHLLYDPVFPLLSTIIIFCIMAYALFARDEARERQLRGAFSRYLSPEMIDRLVANPDLLKLGGESRDMTMLFCDVRGFTTISEYYDAHELTGLINKFLTPMSEAILEMQGTIDKYMGDCVMAFWNAPLDDFNHALHACLASLDMKHRLGRLNAELEADAIAGEREFQPLAIGIGINSGPVVVGNMGSEQRFDYSVLGDNVNLASRLEGLSKLYGVTVVLGENSQKLVPELACLEVDLVKVKGKGQAVRVFALLGDSSVADSEQFKALQIEHDELLAAYRAADWQKGLAAVERCQKLAGDLELVGLYALYQSRLIEFAASPPGEEWDGIYVAETK